jgi:hypothetical protein
MAIGGVAAAAAQRTWPFRVFSFPSEIVRPSIDQILISQQQKFAVHLDPDTVLGAFIIQPMREDYGPIGELPCKPFFPPLTSYRSPVT